MLLVVVLSCCCCSGRDKEEEEDAGCGCGCCVGSVLTLADDSVVALTLVEEAEDKVASSSSTMEKSALDDDDEVDDVACLRLLGKRVMDDGSCCVLKNVVIGRFPRKDGTLIGMVEGGGEKARVSGSRSSQSAWPVTAASSQRPLLGFAVVVDGAISAFLLSIVYCLSSILYCIVL